MRMGPLRMWDLVGIDLFGRERERWAQDWVLSSPPVGNDRRSKNPQRNPEFA